jgi:dolichol-phosphate mannosyltransferase
MSVTQQEALSNWSLAIVCPMANERESAVAVVEAFLNAASPFRNVTFLAVFDRACTDGTVDLMRNYELTEPRLRVVWAPENRSAVDAYIRGYKEALEQTDADWILEADAGLSHRAEDLKNFFPPMLEGYEAIFATRFGKGGEMRHCTLERRIISQGGTLLANLLLGTRLSDMTSGYEMFSRKVLQYVMDRGIQARGHFFQTEVKAYCHKFRVIDVPIIYLGASSTVSGKILGDALKHLWRLFKLRLQGKLY